MDESTYHWKRYWCSREGKYPLTDEGYLHDPESNYLMEKYPDVVSFQSISRNHCLILLGEPGIGKTSAMNEEAEAIDSGIEASGGQTLRIDLNSISGSSDLSKLFDNGAIQDWIKGEYSLHIFLDSLDECLIYIKNLGAILINQLKSFPKDRLYLRIACRTADWQRLQILERELKKLWDRDTIGVFELLPLTKRDVYIAAKTRGYDPEIFLSMIMDRDAGPLASRPVTLKFLLDTYGKNREIPYGKISLYCEGCKLLCKEPNEYRKASETTGKLSWDQRMRIAARIAAMTIFSKNEAIIYDDSISAKENEITIYSLCGGKEHTKEIEFNITEEAIKETLGIGGLFNSRGSGRMGWVHHTYAEFLAAWYLSQNKIPLNQVKSLIYHPSGAIVPLLHGVTSWLCAMDKDVYKEVCKTDPEILLFSDLMNISEADREILVGTFMEQYNKKKLWDRPAMSHLRRLNHSKLGDQLRPYITEKGNSILARQTAISIVMACDLQQLNDELLNVALDPLEEKTIRSWAIHAIIDFDDEIKKKLKPLALGNAGNDPEDEIKGIVLRALWPDFITAEEVFSVLKRSKYPNQIGSYYVFIAHYLMKGLKVEHLPVALKWIKESGPVREMLHLFKELNDDIMRKTATLLSLPFLIDPFANAAASLFIHDHLIIDPNRGAFCLHSDDIRHEVVLKMLPTLVEAKAYLGYLDDFNMPLILSRDIPWMIGCLNNERSEPLQRAWASLIDMNFGINAVIKYGDIVLRACRGNPILASTLSKSIDPIDLCSPKAKEMKEHYQKRQIYLENIENPVPLNPPPKERIAANLDAFDSGNLSAWYGVTMDLTLEPCSTHYANVFDSDLTITSGWKAADMQTKARILKAAKLFLEKQNPEMSGLIGTNTLSYQAISGFKALRLLMHEEPEYLSVIPSCSWKKWASTVITYPLIPSVDDAKIQRNLFKLAYKNAPEEMISGLNIIIDKESKEFGRIFILSKFDDCWDTQLANFIIYKVKDQCLKLTCLVDLLRPLLEHNIKEIRSFTDSYIISPPPTFGEDRIKAIALSSILISYSLDAGWSKIWPAFRSDYEFGKDVILAIQNSVGLRSVGIEFKLMEDQLTDLYLWLVKQYPYSEDPDEMRAHFVTPREEIGRWRDSILDQLSKKGTFEACEGLSRIVAGLPDVELAKMMLTRALKIYYNNSWKPVEANHILELIKDSEKRLVECDDQLIGVLIESLDKLEKKLHDETPAVRDIWDLVDRKKRLYRPIYEEELSDYIKRHLYDDIGERGIILGRNVRIHSGYDETDIHVDAIKNRDSIYEPISVIIEVKGCWNRELRTAMKLQLKDRYLRDSLCTHGIYLIGWFHCDKWDKEDLNYTQSPKISIDDARKLYRDQASELSDSTIHIEAFVLDAGLRNPNI